MNRYDNDPREAAIWIPGSMVISRPESGHPVGFAAEQLLILHTLEEVRRKRRRRTGILGRLKLITRNA
ncbi:hypothetical protein [Microlunatus speluncae]|uniref:hypothetical protein n=1 Tax=Microlunatus speluncae TaxID=2594267 RepID=UPI0012663E4E|nr:hypothetical protein [Microlunatus speluncae]